MTRKVNRQWHLAARPVGLIKESDFNWVEAPIPIPGEGEILVRNVYLSLDPTNRTWMNKEETYLPAMAIGDVMRGITIGVVEDSNNENFQQGDLVTGILGWQDYAVTDGRGLTILPKGLPVPMVIFLSVLGFIGLTAYFGLLDIGKPKSGETLVVSAAAGAVGSLVGQIGKIKSCRVIGIAGTEEKCRWITEELGFDASINYKTESVHESLRKHCPNGVDIYFDNVGGKILDTVLGHINLKARIVLCGMISQYNAIEPVPGPYNFHRILTKRARVEGFIVIDYVNRADEALSDLISWMVEDKIKYQVDVVDGLENVPKVINKLFDGSNKGKLIVKVSEEPSSDS
ncbi:MAG: NADP-dependent oxidoreductase [Promethearchaeota archaeon]